MLHSLIAYLAGSNSATVLALIKALIAKLSAAHLAELLLVVQEAKAAALCVEKIAGTAANGADEIEAAIVPFTKPATPGDGSTAA